MRRSIVFSPAIAILVGAFPFILSCPSRELPRQEPVEPREEPAATTLEHPEAAEALAKRVVLYKLASQEGDLAPFTARPEALTDLAVPEIGKQLNEFWWTIDWSGTRLSPLPSTTITTLETEVFGQISPRLDESDDENGWILFTLGYDPSVIQLLIANEHTDWLPEQRELFLGGGVRMGCLQVWCVRISGEWKQLANMTCSPSVTPPTPPPPPESLVEPKTETGPEGGEQPSEESTSEGN